MGKQGITSKVMSKQCSKGNVNGKTYQVNRVGSEDRKYDVQGCTNGGLGIESRRRTGVHPQNRTGVRRLELVLHEVVTVSIIISRRQVR